jgi:hypothetical protein
MKRGRERRGNDWRFHFYSMYPSLSLAVFVYCVSISCLYGFRRLEYSASCVFSEVEGEDLRLWAEWLSAWAREGVCWTLT